MTQRTLITRPQRLAASTALAWGLASITSIPKASSEQLPENHKYPLVYECTYTHERSRQIGSIIPHPNKQHEVKIDYSFGAWRPWKKPEFSNSAKTLRSRIVINPRGSDSSATFNQVWGMEGWTSSKLGENTEPIHDVEINKDSIYARSGGQEYTYKNWQGKDILARKRVFVYEIDRSSQDSTLTISMLMGTLVQEWKGYCTRAS